MSKYKTENKPMFINVELLDLIKKVQGEYIRRHNRKITLSEVVERLLTQDTLFIEIFNKIKD